MAVTKIRKISSWTLLIVSVISVIALLAFYFGGVSNPGAETEVPVYIDLLLNWTYVLFFITVIATVLFALWQFIGMLKEDPKNAILSVAALVAFVVMLVITYNIGNGTPLKLIGYEGEFNVEKWLKITDMWLYSSYILFVLIIISVVFGSVKKLLSR